MNKLTITEKGLALLQTLYQEDPVDDTCPSQYHQPTTVLPSLKRQKIEKLHRSKNRKFQATIESIKQRHKNILEGRSVAYDRETDDFWQSWKEGWQVASSWNKENQQGRQRYQQRIKERSNNLYGKSWERLSRPSESQTISQNMESTVGQKYKMNC